MNANDAAKAVEGSILGNKYAEFSGICTDTRKNFNGSLYVALIGEKFDGHDYIEKAIETGSRGILWCDFENSKKIEEIAGKYTDIAFIKTENTLKGLGILSGEYIKNYRKEKKCYPVVAITGSVGKTTTKEMTALALSAKYDVCKTAGNFNNEVGVPLTLLSIKNQNSLVVEFGMRGMGQIEYLTNIVKPDAGVITNIGTAHLELLGSRSRIFMAKAEIISGIPENGYLFVNGDNDYLGNKELLDAYIMKVFNKKIKIIEVGEENNCDFIVKNIEEKEGGSHFTIIDVLDKASYEIELHAEGRHNITDAALAFAVAVTYDADPVMVAKKLSEYGKDSLRQKITEKNGIKVIDDTYNANPESMKAALSVLKNAPGRRIAILGSMLELGENSANFHDIVGRHAFNCADIVITAGEAAKYIGKAFEQMGKLAIITENSEKAGKEALRIIEKGDTVLVKGSRGLQMEKAVEMILGGK